MIDVAIVGCGAIAGGYDEVAHASAVRTHAGAYARRSDVRVIACVDPDERQRVSFMARWAIPRGFATIQELVASKLPVQIMSICSPTEAHADGLKEALQVGVKAVFCEKPLTTDLDMSRRLVEAYAQQRVPLAVNYLRRFDDVVTETRDRIRSGAWGKVQSVVGYYGKGILHNGSHLVDLIHYLTDGPLQPQRVLAKRNDQTNGDPTVDAQLVGPGGMPVHLVGTDSRCFDFFELTLVAEQGVIQFEEGGLIVRSRAAVNNPMFPGHRSVEGGERRPTKLAVAMNNAVAAVIESINAKQTLPSDGASAMAAQSVCERLRQMARDF